MKTLGVLPRAVRPGRSRFAFIFLLLTLFLVSCGSGSSSTPSTATTTTISGSVMLSNSALSNSAASGLLVSTTGVLATATFCAAELKGADVYLYDADRLEWLYPVARATTGSDCSYTLHQLINSSFNRNADGSKAYNDNNPIPEGNYTVIASNNIMVTGGTQLVAVQAQVSHFKGPVTGNDLVAYSNNTVPAVERILGYGSNPDGTFCGAGTVAGSDEAIQITFNMAMARVSVINNIRIMDGLGTQVTGRWTVSADLLSATFYPYPALAQGMGYTIYVDAAMQNVYGRRLAASTNCSFVAGAANANAPQAVWYSPAAMTNIPVNTPIQIASSKYLDMGTMLVSSTPSIGDKPAVLYIGNTSTAPGKPYLYEIVPAGLLAYSTSYSISVSGALDLAGNPLAPLSTSFMTMATPTPPAVTSTTPAASATGVALNTEVRAVFSSQMDPLTINATTFTLNGGIANVAGSVSYDAILKTAVFTPTTALLENTLYTAVITTGATDLNGLAMAADKTWSFTTIQPLADTTAPSVPPGLQASAAGTSQINLSWWAASDNVAVTGYKIYNDAGAMLASTAGTSYSHYGLTAGTQYCYSVSALDAAGNESGKSALACASTSIQIQPDTTAPTIPSGFIASAASTSQINLSWGAASDNVAVTGYKIYNDAGILLASTVATNYSHVGLNAGTQYCYSVSAIDAASNESGKSALACASTAMPNPTDMTAPTIPSGLIASAIGPSQINLSWGVASDNVAVTGYKIYNDAGILLASTVATNYSHLGLNAGTQYCYSVSAIDAAGNESGKSALACASTTQPVLPPPGTWTATATTGAPSGRSYHTAIWTGSRMIVWGGINNASTGISDFTVNTGGLYDPVTDAWAATTTLGAPSIRYGHTTVWTGSKMVVWGGTSYGGNSSYATNSGGLYDPATDIWTATATTGAPSARQVHTSVWTGSKMIVWGGSNINGIYLNDGGIYDQASNTWSPMNTTGAPVGRVWPTSVWTGSKMIVWGGYSYQNGHIYHNTGGIYDPATDTWTAITTIGAPTGRNTHTAVWTGSKMLVFGGYDGSRSLNTGGIYDPATDTWTAITTTGAPMAIQHTAVWTGTKMIVWNNGLGGGGIYDPATDIWTATTTSGALSGRYMHSAVWTGTQMIVWGGYAGSTLYNTGGIYTP